MYFRSEKDVKSTLIFWGPILLIILFYMFALNPIVLGYVISALIICLLLWVWFGTGYKINEGLIKIKSGPFRTTVKIADIKKLSVPNNSLATVSFITGPALAMDRIEIHYGKSYNVINISPENKGKFKKLLIAENAYIQME